MEPGKHFIFPTSPNINMVSVINCIAAVMSQSNESAHASEESSDKELMRALVHAARRMLLFSHMGEFIYLFLIYKINTEICERRHKQYFAELISQ